MLMSVRLRPKLSDHLHTWYDSPIQLPVREQSQPPALSCPVEKLPVDFLDSLRLQGIRADFWVVMEVIAKSVRGCPVDGGFFIHSWEMALD
jgi:hypothetical protein